MKSFACLERKGPTLSSILLGHDNDAATADAGNVIGRVTASQTLTFLEPFMPTKKRDRLFDASRIGATLKSVDTPLLPHERDERITVPAAPQPVMVQAQRDIARGLEDTDCYTRLGKSTRPPRKR